MGHSENVEFSKGQIHCEVGTQRHRSHRDGWSAERHKMIFLKVHFFVILLLRQEHKNAYSQPLRRKIMRTIHTLLALSTVACSTSFEDQEQASNQKNPWMESADIEVSLHSPFQDDGDFVPVVLTENVSGLETDEFMDDPNMSIPGGDDLSAAREAG